MINFTYTLVSLVIMVFLESVIARRKWIKGKVLLIISKMNPHFKKEIEKGFRDWKHFYSKFLWLKNSKFFMEIFAFIFLTLFIGWLIYFNSIYVKLILESSLDNMSYLLILVILLLVLLYVIVALNFRNFKGKEYSPYYFAFVSVLLFLFSDKITGGVVFFIVAIILILPGIYYSWTTPRWKLFVIIISMLIILLLGTLILYSVYGDKDEKIFLRNCNDLKIIPNINLICENNIDGISKGKISDFETICILTPNINNISGEINILLANGTVFKKIIKNNEIKFLPNGRTKNINFKINGTYNNETLCMDTTWPAFFKPYEEYKLDKEKFFAYMFALIGIVFITIPPLIIKFEKIIKNG